MALSFTDVERICKSQFPCEVKDLGTGVHSLGHHGFEIIVGTKKNPAHTKSDLAIKGRQLAPKEIPDSRTIYVPGNWDEDKLIEKLRGIKASLPENRILPKFDKKMTSIMGNPEQMYDPELVKKAKLQERQAEQMMEHNDQIVQTLETMTNMLTKLNDRIAKLEEKPKRGRKPKVVPVEMELKSTVA